MLAIRLLALTVFSILLMGCGVLSLVHALLKPGTSRTPAGFTIGVCAMMTLICAIWLFAMALNSL